MAKEAVEEGFTALKIALFVGNFLSIWKFSELLAQGGAQYVRPDVALAGGLTHCKKIAAIAEAHHCAVGLHQRILGVDVSEIMTARELEVVNKGSIT